MDAQIKKLGLNVMSDEHIEELIDVLKETDKLDRSVTVEDVKRGIKEEEEKAELVDTFSLISLPSLAMMFKRIAETCDDESYRQKKMLKVIPIEKLHGIVGHEENVEEFCVNGNKIEDEHGIPVYEENIKCNKLHIVLLDISMYNKMPLHGKPEIYDTQFFMSRLTGAMPPQQFHCLCKIIMNLLGYVYTKYTEIYGEHKNIIDKCIGAKNAVMLLNKHNFTLELVEPGYQIGLFVLYEHEKKLLDLDYYLKK